MSFYFREKPRFGDKLRGKPRDELLQELKQQFDENNKSFFEPAATRLTRDPFERHTGFSRGFPFDDTEGFGRRNSDIRAHLDDLASRHPEFADHLLGPPWGDIPSFHTGSLRNRRRGSGSSSSHHGHPDEDARSQASGSSGTSAASGASGVSSQGEPAAPIHRSTNASSTRNRQEESPNTRRNPIPQYGLRNTVDIGQHRHNMENPEKGNRGQRSMSAPPENRQQDENPNTQDPNAQQSQNPNQRYVSRVDITPQFMQQQPGGEKAKQPQQQPQPQPQPQQQQQQKPQNQQGNVRHIPIFVEGRDEPVIPQNVDHVDHEPSSWSHRKPQTQVPPQFQQPPQFQSPPQFHRPSHFNFRPYGEGWKLPNFEEEFYPPEAPFQQPGTRKTQQQQQFPSQSPPQQTYFRQPQTESRRQQEHPFYAQQAHHQQQQPQPQQQQQPQEPPPEPKKQTQPKDPLEKVAEVQKEVDALTEQVNLWSGTSRKDKQYMYLDEMLTRELIKLDDIETEGKENVRQARKNAIKSIQNSISLLESKAPLADQQQQQQQQPMEQEAPAEITNPENPEAVEKKEEKTESEQQTNEQQAIPLPPAPSSPAKEPLAPENQNTEQPQSQESVQENQNAVPEEQSTTSQENNAQAVPMESAPVEKVASVGSMEVQTAPETEQAPVTEQPPVPEPAPATAAPKVEPENQAKSPKVAKKVKKSKKQPPQQQTPISDGAIPLPAPETHQTDTAK